MFPSTAPCRRTVCLSISTASPIETAAFRSRTCLALAELRHSASAIRALLAGLVSARHCVRVSVTDRESLPSGKYADHEGTLVCENCAPATYQPAAGAAYCLDCPLRATTQVGSQTRAYFCFTVLTVRTRSTRRSSSLPTQTPVEWRLNSLIGLWRALSSLCLAGLNSRFRLPASYAGAKSSAECSCECLLCWICFIFVVSSRSGAHVCSVGRGMPDGLVLRCAAFVCIPLVISFALLGSSVRRRIFRDLRSHLPGRA
jgi:hypothetical protein